MDKKNVLETKRLVLREFEEKDLEEFMKYRNNTSWMRFQNFKNLDKNAFRAKLLIPLDFDKGSQLVISKKEDNVLIGDLYIMREGKRIYLGYAINPDYSRNGYMKEMVTETLKFLQFRYPGCLIVAETDIDNISSIKLLEKVGFYLNESNDKELIFIYK